LVKITTLEFHINYTILKINTIATFKQNFNMLQLRRILGCCSVEHTSSMNKKMWNGLVGDGILDRVLFSETLPYAVSKYVNLLPPSVSWKTQRIR